MFSLPKPYVLLSADDVKAFMYERDSQLSGREPGEAATERFRGVMDLFMPYQDATLGMIHKWAVPNGEEANGAMASS